MRPCSDSTSAHFEPEPKATINIIDLIITSQMPSVLQQTQVEVEQLRREAAMKRIPVSQAVEDIKVSCTVQ